MVEVKLHERENLYFILKVIFTPIVWIASIVLLSSMMNNSGVAGTAVLSTLIMYILIIWFFIFGQKIFLVAYMKGNGIEINESQFPNVYSKYKSMAENLGIKKIPKLFILQEGGILNAFAVRFSGKNYISIYSEIFSLIEEDEEAVLFVLAHELAHVKCSHMSKRFWTFPSAIIPFLNGAYSRSCEYTCDNVGNSLLSNSVNGLVLLAAGPRLYKKIDLKSYIDHHRENSTFLVSFVGLFLSHPYLPRRIENIKGVI